MHRILFMCFLFGIVTVVTADESDESKSDSASLEGDGDPFRNFADEAGQKVKDGGQLMKEFADQGSKAGMDAMKSVADGATGFAKSAADQFGKASQDGIETAKGFADDAQKMSESAMGAMQGFATGIGQGFNRIGETGGKIMQALGGAATKSKEELETAGSKVSEITKGASNTIFGLLG